MTEISTSGARTAAFYLVQFLSWVGMYLLWFEGDQVSGMIVPYFALHVGTMFLSASFWLTEGSSTRILAIRTIGSFFLFWFIEGALCMLEPTYSGSAIPDMISSASLIREKNRWRAAYVGGVFILISVFLSFLLSYVNFSAPNNAGSRIATLRGLLYLVAVATCIVSSAISWSYKPVCPTTPTAYKVTNAVLILEAVIILTSLLYGCAEADSVALLVACMGVITYGPVYYNKSLVSVSHEKWKAHDAVVFCGLYCFILGVFLDRVASGVLPLGARIAVGIKERVNKLDIIGLALGIAGAICTYAFNTTDQEDYNRSYGLIIPLFSLLGAITGTESGKIISTFFGFVVLTSYDVGSGQTTTGYVRGGLLMLEGCVLVTVLSNTIRGRSLEKIVAYPAYVAIAQFVIGCFNVPNDYSKYFLIALTVIGAECYEDLDYNRVAFLLLAWNGFTWNFLLTVGTVGVFQIINWTSALVFTYHYLKGGAQQAPALKFGKDANEPVEAVEAVKEAA